MSGITGIRAGILLTLLIGQAASAAESYDRDAALATSQGAVGREIGDYIFRDRQGQAFRLASLEGRPLVVSMIYTSCHHVCPLITKRLAESIDIAREALGEDTFTVVTIGFDWANDTPDRMRMFAAQQGVDVPGWYFLAGDTRSIDALSEDLGFLFFASPKGFDHLAQTTVVDANGLVYRQIYGQNFEPPALVEPLKELVFDTPREAGFVDHWMDTLRLFCTVYDPNTGRYRFDYSIFTAIATGLISLGAVAFFVVREWRRSR